MPRSIVSALLLLAALVAAPPASGEVPTATAKVGEPFSHTGLVHGHPTAGRDTPFYISDRDHDRCSLRDGEILWEPGVSTAGGVGLVQVEGGWNVTASGTHTFKGRTAVGAVDFTITCGQSVQRHTYVDWVDITVTEGSGTSCPAGAGATISQSTSCPYYGSDEKWLFRKLAKIAWDGYVVDKAINDLIEAPEESIKGQFKDIAVVEWLAGKLSGKGIDKLLDKLGKRFPRTKLIPIGDILDAAEYASYLDLAKYTVLDRLANDPPDPEFSKLAAPTRLPEFAKAPQLGSLDRREVGLYIALLTTVERAGGAAAAGDTAAEARQLRHASGLANRLVAVLGAREAALRKAAKALPGRAVELPRAIVRSALRRADAQAFRGSQRTFLRRLGFTEQELRGAAANVPAVRIARLGKGTAFEAQARVLRAQRAALARFADRHALAGR